MKRSLLLASLFLCVHSYAQKIVGTFADGGVIETTDTLFDGSSCSFRLDTGEEADWSLLFLCNDRLHEVLASSSSGSFQIRITPSLMTTRWSDEPNWYDLKKYVNGRSVYHKAYVTASVGGQPADTLELPLRVAPLLPIIREVHMRHDGFLGVEPWYENQWMSLDLDISVPYTNVTLRLAGYWDDPEKILFQYYFPVGVTDMGGFFRTDEVFWDIDQCWKVKVANSYSVVESDTIYTNDYIPREEMQIIDDYYSTGIVSAGEDEVRIATVGRGTFRIDTPETVLAVDVVDLGGRHLPFSHEGDLIKVSNRYKGAALLIVKTYNNSITKKIQL